MLTTKCNTNKTTTIDFQFGCNKNKISHEKKTESKKSPKEGNVRSVKKDKRNGSSKTLLHKNVTHYKRGRHPCDHTQAFYNPADI